MRQTNTPATPENADKSLSVPLPRWGIGGLLRARADMLAAEMSPPEGPGRTFVYWLAQACKRAREEAGLTQSDIRAANQPRVSRFEKNAKWPDDPEDLVQAYAQALGLKDSRALWELALDYWIEHGQPPKPIEPPQVPAIPEGHLLQRLREGLPSDRDRRPQTTRRATRRRASG